MSVLFSVVSPVPRIDTWRKALEVVGLSKITYVKQQVVGLSRITYVKQQAQ